MKISFSTAFLIALAGVAAVTIYASRKISRRKMLVRVADEGYETAGDILYPHKRVKGRLHYGPVLPN